ncbi:MAG: thymidine kinase [Candidatus Dormibacteraeota bacterium]|nr:thymidine kinase [Candidatus Dormibacteraeota bacterium]
MFSNKSGELIRLVTVHRIAGRRVTLFKHSLDDRYDGPAAISTHGGVSLEAESVATSEEISRLSAEAEVVAIDEAQFFDEGLPQVVRDLVEQGATMFAAGLDRDFRGDPFGPMPALLALADDVMKLRAVCMRCRSLEGTMTQRLVDGRPAPPDSPQVLVGAAESYEARCRACHEVPHG